MTLRHFSNLMRSLATRLLPLLGAAACASQAAERPAVEVQHWWTSGSEAVALAPLHRDLAQRGFAWRDGVGEGSEARKRMIALARARIGPMPDALQVHVFDLRASAATARYVSWDDLAAAEHWDAVVPLAIQQAAKVDGHWRAVPLNIHRTNLMWANKAIFDELGLAPPTTFAELLEVARRVRAAGYQPLAHGGEPWQNTFFFDNAVLAVGGPAFYRKLLLERDPAALASPKVAAAFEQVRALAGLVDANAKGRAWNFATAMVASRRAAMQVMGDWAKGEFSKRGRLAGRDFLCFPYPGTAGSFVFVVDLFAMPDLGEDRREGQRALALTLMDPATQGAFNAAKGSLPARTDVALDGFDSCARQSAQDLQAAARGHTLLNRFADGSSAKVRTTIQEVVTQFIDSDELPASAARRLRRALLAP